MNRRSPNTFPSPALNTVALLSLTLASLAAAGRSVAAPSAPAKPSALITPAIRAAIDGMRADAIRSDVRFLSDDSLEGRDTGSVGGLMAARYIARQLKEAGVAPAGDDGTYLQKVPFVRRRQDPAKTQVVLKGASGERRLQFGEEILSNGSATVQANVQAPLVFAGFGITAPEFKYDDYAGVDVKGKLVVLLSGEPASEDAAYFDGARPSKHAAGRAKVDLARKNGAVGVLTIPTGRDASDSFWQGSLGAQSRSRLILPSEQAAFPALLVRPAAARKLLENGPAPLEELTAAAFAGKSKSAALGQEARLDLVVEDVPTPGYNVVGKVEGGDPELKRQAVVYSAHYDHVGRGTGEGDTIFNGAWDNASGTSGVLEVARTYAKLRPAPRRSLVFVFVTGEERGLLGAQHYVRHPAFPVEQTAANINLDMTDIFGLAKEIVPVGAEYSSLSETAENVAREMGMKIGKEPMPELGIFRRSDQFVFVSAGIPALFLTWANEYEDLDPATARARMKQKMDTIYHKPSDEFDPSWSWQGMRRHAQVAFLLGLQVANQYEMPAWKSGVPFDKPRKTPDPAE